MGFVNPSWEVLIAVLKLKEVNISMKYLDFAKVFFFDSAIEVSEYFTINNHIINLEKGKQPLYGLIYSLGLIQVKTLYI